jgi:DNA-binding response OmpR family regulator
MVDATRRGMPAVASSSPLAVRAPVIVLAEDDAALRGLIAEALTMDGHHVVQVATGNALIDAVKQILAGRAQEGQLDLLISDVRMPELGGVEAIELLRAAELRIPIILITAFSDLWTRAKAARFGARLLDKPLELRVLRKAVREELAAGSD